MVRTGGNRTMTTSTLKVMCYNVITGRVCEQGIRGRDRPHVALLTLGFPNRGGGVNDCAGVHLTIKVTGQHTPGQGQGQGQGQGRRDVHLQLIMVADRSFRLWTKRQHLQQQSRQQPHQVMYKVTRKPIHLDVRFEVNQRCIDHLATYKRPSGYI